MTKRVERREGFGFGEREREREAGSWGRWQDRRELGLSPPGFT